MVEAVKVFKCKIDDAEFGNIISETEAKEFGIDITGCQLISITDCQSWADGREFGAYLGEIEVLEGYFLFNWETRKYEQLKEE